LKCYRRQDGNLRWSDGGAIVRQLEQLMRAWRPAAVITFGEDGLYYHPDHIATYKFTRRAVDRLADPPLLYRSIWPRALTGELVSELIRLGMPTDLWNIEPETFGVDDDARADEIELDVSPFARRKLCALRCHRTQLGPRHAFTALPEELVERYLGIERFAPVAAAPHAAVVPDPDGGWLTHVVEEAIARA
jgi:N-acetyl-1-D-myo-inositol-2-amino-2-deoxy-alpha-D-glucopyranoside deacetylase